MISSRRLAQLTRRWLRAAAAGRKRIPFRKEGAANTLVLDSEAAGATPPPARKGHFVVYSGDGQRFEVPLSLLKSGIFRELLDMSEDAFGLPGAGPITLPCDATFLGSVVSCLRRRPSRDAQGALLAAMAGRPCSASFAPCSSIQINQPLVVC